MKVNAMKHVLIFLMIFSFVAFSCEENESAEEIIDSDCPPASSQSSNTILSGDPSSSPVKSGDYLLVKKDGACWNPQAYMDTWPPTGDSLYIFAFGDEQSLRIKFKYNGVGTYQLSDGSNNAYFGHAVVEYYTTIGQDVIVSRHVLQNNIGTMSITEYNSHQRIIKGTFEFNLERIYSNPGPDPESISFTSGKFKLHLPD